MSKKLMLSMSLFSSLSMASEIKFVEGEVIVKFKAGKEKSFFKNKSLSVLGVAADREIKTKFEHLNVLKFNAQKSKISMNEILTQLRSSPDILYAEPNFIYSVNPIIERKSLTRTELMNMDHSLTNTPDDPQFSKLWGLRNTGSNDPKGKVGVPGADVNALKAWDLTKGSRAIKIAVIDTGVDYNHPDLKENTWINAAELSGIPGVDDDGNGQVDDIHGYDFANNDADPMDGHGHGTHCSGTIGAIHNNQTGVSGVMGEVTVVPVKFLGDDGSGTLESAVKAIDYATSLNVDLMSNSWGGGGFSQALFDAIQRASDKGIIFTAAAGNESSNNDTSPSYPASYQIQNVISVAALTAQNGLASFSCYGRNSVHIAAPGQNILSTVKGGDYAIMSGTSMATPHVSGVIGLLLAKEGRLPVNELKQRVIFTGVPVAALRSKTIMSSRIDAYNLLTDTRPETDGPKVDEWKTMNLEEAFESEHPYKENAKIVRTITIPGAKFVRVKFAKFDLEAGYDSIKVMDKARNQIERVTGAGENYTTDYAEGDSVTLEFTSDRSVSKWGYLVAQVEVQ